MSLSEKLCQDMLDKFLSDVSKIFFNPESQTTLILTTAVVTTVVILSCYKMDLMRYIQDYKGSGQSPSNAENKEKLKEIYKQKDTQIKKLETRVLELETLLKAKHPTDDKQKDILKVLSTYEDLIAKVMADNDIVHHENKILKQQVTDLSETVKELMEKYERTKTVIEGMIENEKTLHLQKDRYEKFIKVLEGKYLTEKKKNDSGDCSSKGNICKFGTKASGRV